MQEEERGGPRGGCHCSRGMRLTDCSVVLIRQLMSKVIRIPNHLKCEKMTPPKLCLTYSYYSS